MFSSINRHLKNGLFYLWRLLKRTVYKYIETDGELRAASFAYYAFFALFPLILLFVSLGSWVLKGNEQEVADAILSFANNYLPVDHDAGQLITSTVEGVVRSRGTAGIIAALALVWSSLRFFQALVQGVNQAWGMEAYSWWRLPLTNLGMVAITASTLFIGVVTPVILKAIESYWISLGFVGYDIVAVIFSASRLILPSIILFYGLAMFYKYAPRRKTKFKEIFVAAVVATIALQLVSKGFVVYADNIGRFNRLYGTLSGVVAVLMWIYLSGSVLIFAGCLSAAQSDEAEGKPI